MSGHLTPERIKELISYDPETGDLIWSINMVSRSRLKKPGNKCGHIDKDGYLSLNIKGKHFPGHCVAWAIFYGEWPKMEIDHINMIKNDNRIENLRCATRSQNQCNIKPTSRLGIKGVTLLPHGSYQAQIRVNGANKYLGSFKTADEAAHAYNKMAVKHHGEFAVLNPVGAA